MIILGSFRLNKDHKKADIMRLLHISAFYCDWYNTGSNYIFNVDFENPYKNVFDCTMHDP